MSQLSPDQGYQQLDDYMNSLQLYHGAKKTRPPPFPSEHDLFDKNGQTAKLTSWHHETWRTWPGDAKKWDDLAKDSVGIAGYIRPSSPTFEASTPTSPDQNPSERLFMLSLGKTPAAFVQTDHRTATAAGMSPTAHLGVNGAGTALVEAAVNDSQARGLGGKLEVTPNNGGESFYKRVGFDPKTWELDPEKSELWQHHDNKWSYAPLNEKGYLAAQTGENNILGYDPAANAAALERPSSSHSNSSTSSESSEE